MDRATELLHLRKADNNIEKAHQRIEHQNELIARMREQLHDLTMANSILQTMRDTLSVMMEHRRLIVLELQR